MENVRFLSNPLLYNPVGTFTAHISGICNKNELFEQLQEKLLLPDYFGYNWDALYDCLRDFHWIKQKKIALVHDDLPILDESELKTYLDVLMDAVLDWNEYEEHSLEVVFSEDTKGTFSFSDGMDRIEMRFSDGHIAVYPFERTENTITINHQLFTRK